MGSLNGDNLAVYDMAGEHERRAEKINEGISGGYLSENFSSSEILSPSGDLNPDDSGKQKANQSPLDMIKDSQDAVDFDQEYSDIAIKKRDVPVEDRRDMSTTAEILNEVQNVELDSSADKAAVSSVTSHGERIITPHSQLPNPEAPPGYLNPPPEGDYHQVERSLSLKDNFPAIGKYIRDQSNSLSAAIARRILSFKETDESKSKWNNVTEFNLLGLKVIVKQKDENRDFALKGRISFFSRSNCRDCTAVRSFFREKDLKFVEINIDVYPSREKELVERTGTSSVPQIFFNEKFFGGLVALNSLRNSGEFDQRLTEMIGRKCPDDAPAPPVYGFDDHDEDIVDEMIAIVRVLRQRLPIQDRLLKMKLVNNCFAGAEMVEVVIQHLGCGRQKAIEIGKQLARKHFIHHVFREHDFEDGNHFYRFLEHEPFISRCINFRGSTNDGEPQAAAVVGLRLTKIMSAILESYASDDRRHVDYIGISNSEEFRRYVILVQDLHRIDIVSLSLDEKLAFFLNLYNAMVIHSVIRGGRPNGVIDRRSFFSDFQYLVGGNFYSLNIIKNGILRSNRRSPYSLMKPFSSSDSRLEKLGEELQLTLPKLNPLIHFGLCNGTRSSPSVRFFSPTGVEAELRCAARDFFKREGIEVELDKRTVHLSRIIKWFSADFGQEKEILKWVINFLDATKAGLLTHLMSDGGPIHVVYDNYDWSVNS